MGVEDDKLRFGIDQIVSAGTLEGSGWEQWEVRPRNRKQREQRRHETRREQMIKELMSWW